MSRLSWLPTTAHDISQRSGIHCRLGRWRRYGCWRWTICRAMTRSPRHGRPASRCSRRGPTTGSAQGATSACARREPSSCCFATQMSARRAARSSNSSPRSLVPRLRRSPRPRSMAATGRADFLGYRPMSRASCPLACGTGCGGSEGAARTSIEAPPTGMSIDRPPHAPLETRIRASYGQITSSSTMPRVLSFSVAPRPCAPSEASTRTFFFISRRRTFLAVFVLRAGRRYWCGPAPSCTGNARQAKASTIGRWRHSSRTASIGTTASTTPAHMQSSHGV